MSRDASRACERAVAVLTALEDGPIGVTEVAERAALPKSTAARLLGSLAREGLVEQVSGETRYRIGPRIVSLAAGVRPTRSLLTVARPTHLVLATASGEAAGLSVPDGALVQYVDQVDSTNPVAVRDWTGTRLPMHAVSSGLVMLAQLPAPMLARYLAEPLEAFTPRTLTDAGALQKRLRDVRRDGHAWVHDEYAVGITSVAAPIADARAEIVAAVHVHGPSNHFPTAGDEDRIAVAVRTAAARIGARLRAGG